MFSTQVSKLQRVVSFMTSKLDRLKDQLSKLTVGIDECPGETDSQRLWLSKAMGNADFLRQEIQYFERRLEMEIPALNKLLQLDVHARIQMDEREALDLHKLLTRATRTNTIPAEIDSVKVELKQVLDELQEFYFERQEVVNQLEAERNVTKTVAAIAGTEKLGERGKVGDRDKRKAKQRARSMAAEAAKTVRAA